MKNKWSFFAVTLAVVLCMTVFSVTAYAGGGDMVDSTMGDPTMESPTATTQPENTNTGEQPPNGQTLTVLVTENADGSHTVTIGDRSWTLPAKREQAGKVVNVLTLSLIHIWITHEVIPSIRKHGAYMTDSLLDALEAHPEACLLYTSRCV